MVSIPNFHVHFIAMCVISSECMAHKKIDGIWSTILRFDIANSLLLIPSVFGEITICDTNINFSSFCSAQCWAFKTMNSIFLIRSNGIDWIWIVCHFVFTCKWSYFSSLSSSLSSQRHWIKFLKNTMRANKRKCLLFCYVIWLCIQVLSNRIRIYRHTNIVCCFIEKFSSFHTNCWRV